MERRAIEIEGATNKSQISGAAPDMVCHRFSSGEWTRELRPVPREMALTIYVNGQELVTILCTPSKLNCLVMGFLYSEGIISDVGDVAVMRVCEDESLADVRLSKPEWSPSALRTLSSGCGGAVSFNTELKRVNSGLMVAPAEVLSLMKQLSAKAELFRLCGGVHASALCDAMNLLVVAEDIGRHNTLDKILGECLLAGVSTKNRLLLTTGRLSSEMVMKAAKMEVPIVFSRSSPTDRSISLAQEAGITLIGYVRANRLSVYTHEERLRTS